MSYVWFNFDQRNKRVELTSQPATE